MRVGILIIGSLYWDPVPVRAAWRHNRLDLPDVRRVSAPIRYGRLSVSRGHTFTMVFSQSCSDPDRLGTALVARAVAECATPDDLIMEAQHLWAAERNQMEIGPVSASWGRTGLLVNPESSIPASFLERWQRLPGRKRKPAPTEAGEAAVIDEESGLALIAWPSDLETGRPLEGYDALLMTATVPTLQSGRYPTAADVADAWIHDRGGRVAYFHSNRQHGITTFQDDEIEGLLRGEGMVEAEGNGDPHRA